MRNFRLPLWTLLALVLFFAVAFGALKHPSESVASAVFSLAVLSLCVAPLVAVASDGRICLAWLAFAMFGWAYLRLTFFGHMVPIPRLVLSEWVTTGLDYLELSMDANQTEASQHPELYYSPSLIFDAAQTLRNRQIEKSIEFRQVGHSLATLLVGFIAALVVPGVIRLDQSKHDDTHAPERP